MMFKRIKNIIIYFFVTFVSFSSFFVGISLLFKNKEQITFLNADEYIKENSPYYSLLFEYTPNSSINNTTINNQFKERVNRIDIEYYNKSTFFNTTKEATFEINGQIVKKHLSDTSYNEKNPLVSTHLLKLISGSKKFDDAFGEGAEDFSLNFNAIEAHINETYKLQVYNGQNVIENKDVEWLSDDETVASIDRFGNITTKKEGSVDFTVKYGEKEASIHLDVLSSDCEARGAIQVIPVVVPTSMLDAIGGSRDSYIGTTFTSILDEKEYCFKIGGYYDSSVEYGLYRTNIDEFIYFPRSERYTLPIEKCYLRLGGDKDAISRVYGDIQLLKKICKLKFRFPEEAPVNQVKTDNLTLYERVNNFSCSWQIILLPISLLLLFVTCSLLNLFYLKDSYIKKLLPISLYIFGISLPCLICYFVKTISVNGVNVPILTSVAGWLAIIIAIVATIMLLLQLLSKEKKDSKAVEIPIINGTKNCIYIAKGANLPNQNASALRVDSIIRALQESGYGFHVIGQTNAKKGDIYRISNSYYIHSTYDKSETAENSLIEKIKSLYFPGDFIYNRVCKILENNKIDYIFIYQTLPIQTVERLYQLSIKKGFKLVFDIVEYQTLGQQRNIAGVLLNYVPSKKILEKYTQYGKSIAISTYLYNFLYSKDREVLYVPFFFDVDNLQNSSYKYSNKKRLIYAGAPFGKRDTIGNVIKGLNLLSDKEKSNFEISFAGMTRNDMKKLGVAEEELAKADWYVKFYGRIPHEQVVQLYAKSDFSILLKPADKRFSKAGFPTKISESWALSTPVIANISGDIGTYLIDNINGIVVNSDSPEDFADALRRVISLGNDTYNKMRAESRKTALSRLSCNTYSKMIKEFLEKN